MNDSITTKIFNSLPTINESNNVLTVSGINDYCSVTSWAKPHISLQKSDGTYINVDDIMTTQDLTSTIFLWESLFLAICKENPSKRNEYMVILKLYKEDYKQAVLAIETGK